MGFKLSGKEVAEYLNRQTAYEGRQARRGARAFGETFYMSGGYYGGRRAHSDEAAPRASYDPYVDRREYSCEAYCDGMTCGH